MNKIQERYQASGLMVGILRSLQEEKRTFSIGNMAISTRRAMWKANAPKDRKSGIYSRRGKRRELI